MFALIKIFKTTSFRDGGSGSLFLKSCLEELELFVHTPPLGDHRLQVQAHDSRLGNGKLPSCHGFAGTRDNRARKSNPCLAGRGEHRSVIRGRTLCFLASHWPLLACLRLRRGDGSCPGPCQRQLGLAVAVTHCFPCSAGRPGGGPMPIRAFNDAINASRHNASTRGPCLVQRIW
jgi:hypothetical protein